MKREDLIREIRNGVLNVDALVDSLAKEGHIKLDPEPEPGKDYGEKMAERVIKLDAGRAAIVVVGGTQWINEHEGDQPWVLKKFRYILAPHFQAAYEDGKAEQAAACWEAHCQKITRESEDAIAERNRLKHFAVSIGNLIGCNHYEDEDGLERLVTCVRDKIEAEYVRGELEGQQDADLSSRIAAIAEKHGRKPDNSTPLDEDQLKRLGELEAALPRTADGLLIVPGMTVWVPASHADDMETLVVGVTNYNAVAGVVDGQVSFRSAAHDCHPNCDSEIPASSAYSTRALAQAAAAANGDPTTGMRPVPDDKPDVAPPLPVDIKWDRKQADALRFLCERATHEWRDRVGLANTQFIALCRETVPMLLDRISELEKKLTDAPQPSAPASPAPLAADQVLTTNSGQADDIRRLGWTVAVHNDYKLNGELQTFWLFTRDDQAIKGEGETDAMALDIVRRKLQLSPTEEPAPASPAPSPEADVEKADAIVTRNTCRFGSGPWQFLDRHRHTFLLDIAAALTEERQQARKAAVEECLECLRVSSARKEMIRRDVLGEKA